MDKTGEEDNSTGNSMDLPPASSGAANGNSSNASVDVATEAEPPAEDPKAASTPTLGAEAEDIAAAKEVETTPEADPKADAEPEHGSAENGGCVVEDVSVEVDVQRDEELYVKPDAVVNDNDFGNTGRHWGIDVALYTLCWAMVFTCFSAAVTTSNYVAKLKLPPGSLLVSFPLAACFVGAVIIQIPNPYIVNKFGRKVDFVFGFLTGALGSVLSVVALLPSVDSFALFVFGHLFIGGCLAVGFCFRFAAGETAPMAKKNMGASFVLAGGLVAAVIGPQISKEAIHMFGKNSFYGVYVIFCIIFGCGSLLVPFARFVVKKPSSNSGRPIKEIVKQPKCFTAFLFSSGAYSLMMLVMSVVPVNMATNGYAFEQSAAVMQAHFVCMFGPNFFVPLIISKLGLNVLICAGILLFITSKAVLAAGTALANYFVGMIALGFAWSFLFVGATAQLSSTWQPLEAPRVQALNDLCFFAATAVLSLLSGIILQSIGWQNTMYLGIGLAGIPLLAFVWLQATGQYRTPIPKEVPAAPAPATEMTAPAPDAAGTKV